VIVTKVKREKREEESTEMGKFGEVERNSWSEAGVKNNKEEDSLASSSSSSSSSSLISVSISERGPKVSEELFSKKSMRKLLT
jgi:hypothetical protein